MSRKVVIIGGGPAGLIAADYLSHHYEVHLYEKGKTLGRKFLVAGKGGFNLTNRVVGNALIDKYSPSGFLDQALSEFDSDAVRKWLSELGVPTYVGSSGRVFPEKGIKPIEVLNRIKERLIGKGVNIHYSSIFTGFTKEQKPIIMMDGEEVVLSAPCLFALGGASWKVTGSEGEWLSYFESLGVKTNPLQASNCGLELLWPDDFKNRCEGKPLKNIAIRIEGKYQKGEAIITEYGIEGNAIYPIVPEVRAALQKQEEVKVYIDLKPQLKEEVLVSKYKKGMKTKAFIDVLKLDKTQLSLLKLFTSKEDYIDPRKLIPLIKKLPLPVSSLRTIDEAISTVGGIAISEVNKDYALQKYPSLFVAGEMVDWDAPTGGFLLQGCFSTGIAAAKGIEKLLSNKKA